MDLKFCVKRHRMSVTQGEAEVIANGNVIVRYGDDIALDGKYGDIISGYGSIHDDNSFIIAAMRQYPEKIINIKEDDVR